MTPSFYQGFLKKLSKPLFFVLVFLFNATARANAGGLIPCGRNISADPTNPASPADPNNPLNAPCTLCHVAILVQNIINFLMGLTGILTVLAIVAGGATYVLAVGNPGIISKAKSAIQWALGGFVITLTAWLIVNVIIVTMGYSKPIDGGTDWWKFTINCQTPAPIVTTPTTTPAPATTGGGDG